MVGPGRFVSTLLATSLDKASQLVLGTQGLDAATAPATGNIAYTLPTERTFLLNVPEDYQHGQQHPLVLSFHGGEQHIPLAARPPQTPQDQHG